MNWQAAEEAKQAELAEEGWVDVMCKFLSYGNTKNCVDISPETPLILALGFSTHLARLFVLLPR